ncbi:hypothetical protein LINGRAHAP2_LOCUS8887 [Linum grandiflorum]
MLLRMVVLMFAMAFGVYICTICLHQITTRSKVRIQDIQVIERASSSDADDDLFQVPKLHYPNPESFSREECVDNPVRYFAIVSTQRSGSGWFETLLNSHVNVSSNGEIFSVLDRRRNVSAIVQTLDKVYNLDWFSSASKNECSGAVGFKWMLNQGFMEHHEEIVEYLNRRGVSLVFMFRRNLLRRMVSLLANSYDKYAKLLNGTHKSHVHTAEEAEMLSKYKPTVNSTLLVAELRKAEDMVTAALKHYNTTRHIVVYYEDLVKDRKTEGSAGVPEASCDETEKPAGEDPQGSIVGADWELGRREQDAERNRIREFPPSRLLKGDMGLVWFC